PPPTGCPEQSSPSSEQSSEQSSPSSEQSSEQSSPSSEQSSEQSSFVSAVLRAGQPRTSNWRPSSLSAQVTGAPCPRSRLHWIELRTPSARSTSAPCSTRMPSSVATQRTHITRTRRTVP